MKRPLIQSALAFSLSAAITFAVRGAMESEPDKTAAVAPAPAPAPAPALVRQKPHREESAFSRIRALLRDGNLEGARQLLHELGQRDPVAFFELLEKLPGLPGVEEIIESAAVRLPWNQPEITSLLNHIGPDRWRDVAWEAYTFHQIDRVPDEEIFRVGIQCQVKTSCGGVRRLMDFTAEHRPQSFWGVLNKIGGTSFREEFFEMAMAHHPHLARELTLAIPASGEGVNYDRAYVLQARSRCLPTADALMETFADLGPRGTYSWDFAGMFTGHAYRGASESERGKIFDAIESQPALARNRMAAGLLFADEPRPPDELSRILSITSSGAVQRESLEHWLKAQPDLDPADRGWIDVLPTEKLRLRANEMLDERLAQSGKRLPEH